MQKNRSTLCVFFLLFLFFFYRGARKPRPVRATENEIRQNQDEIRQNQDEIRQNQDEIRQNQDEIRQKFVFVLFICIIHSPTFNP
jgi:ABC-type transporter MlaC component